MVLRRGRLILISLVFRPRSLRVVCRIVVPILGARFLVLTNVGTTFMCPFLTSLPRRLAKLMV